jgi:DNA polymerase-3 subunit delta
MADRPTLLIGEEDFLAEGILAGLINAALTPDDQRMNLDVLDATQPIGELLTRLDTAPFFGPARVVVIRRLEALRESEHEPLVAFLERGDHPTVAIFVARELDRRRRLFATFKRVARIIETKPLAPRDVPAWVAQRFTTTGKRAAPGTAERLAALAGGSLRDLAHEVDKVVTYVGERAAVTPADVDAIASRTGDASIFTLVDAIGGGNAPHALRALHDILATHEPLQVLFMVARQFRLILRAHTLIGARRPPADLAMRLGVHPFVARKLSEQARRYRAGQFAEIFAVIEDTDRMIKSGSPARLMLEWLFVRLCASDRRPETPRGSERAAPALGRRRPPAAASAPG